MTRFALFACAALIISAPAMADEFGSRFGNTSPYALQNTFDTAKEDMAGIGPEDLNDISPAAGDEMDVDTQDTDDLSDVPIDEDDASGDITADGETAPAEGAEAVTEEATPAGEIDETATPDVEDEADEEHPVEQDQ